MDFPVTLLHTWHKFGGRIERIDRIVHTTARPLDGRSQDTWEFVGAVAWRDGTRSEAAHIAPFQLCYEDEQHQGEVNALCDAMNAYLLAHGTWSHDGPISGWTATERPAAHCPSPTRAKRCRR